VQPGSHLILMGPQGAGKGTQAERLAPALDLYHLSTGEAFRAAIKAGTEVGKLAKGYLDRGELVPDEITVAVVAAKLGQLAESRPHGGLSGALFDGFPRTRAQAEGLDAALAELGERVGAVLEIEVPRALLIERLQGRWTCPVCGAVYHERFNPPRVPGRCDNDGAELIQRSDDTLEAITRRLELYDEQTRPLTDYYAERGLLARIDGNRPINEVTEDLLARLGGRVAREGVS
jgi:adenylate kinase